MVNIAITVTNTAAMRPIQRSKRVTNLESKNVINVARAIGTNTERPKDSAATTNAISKSAQIPLSAAVVVSDEGRVRIRESTAPARSIFRGECVRNDPSISNCARQIHCPAQQSYYRLAIRAPLGHESHLRWDMRVLMLNYPQAAFRDCLDFATGL